MVDSNGVRTSTSCHLACDGLCCQGSNACLRFTGKVCKDGSCNGFGACEGANIPQVINSCRAWPDSGGDPGTQDGERACKLTGGAGVDPVGNFTDSCWGKASCENVGYNGQVGNVVNSCHGAGAATSAGESNVCKNVGAEGGAAGNIISSCHGRSSCSSMARRNYEGLARSVGDIMNSCGSWELGFALDSQGNSLAGESNCLSLAKGGLANREPISQVMNCCRSGSSCSNAASDTSLIAMDSACEAAISAFTVSTFFF